MKVVDYLFELIFVSELSSIFWYASNLSVFFYSHLHLRTKFNISRVFGCILMGSIIFLLRFEFVDGLLEILFSIEKRKR